MPSIQNVCDYLESFAPTRLAEEWDNVGLLAGDPAIEASRIMTCLTITPESAAEAIAQKANLIVTHHPLPFRPLQKLTTDQTGSKLLWDLIRAGVSIYSPHTGFDSAKNGINHSLASKLGAKKIKPLHPIQDDPDKLGTGRYGELTKAVELEAFLNQVKTLFGLEAMQFVAPASGILGSRVKRIGVACGSGGSFLEQAIHVGCDTFVTGETNFHTCLEASSRNISLILLGHYASERFAVEMLADQLNHEFKDAEVWASQEESDPVHWT